MKLKNVIKNIGISFFIFPVMLTMGCTGSQQITDLDAKQILKNFEDNFEKNQDTNHQQFYPGTWNVNDIKKQNELGIKIPENPHKIEIKFRIKEIDLDNGKIKVIVETQLIKNPHSFEIEIKNFKIKAQEEFDQLKNLLTNITIKDSKLLPTEINEQNAFSLESGIQWPSETARNGHEIKIIEIYDQNNEKGTLKIRVEIHKNNFKEQIVINLKNGKTDDIVFEDLKNYFNQFDESNMLDLSGKEIDKDSTWEDVLEEFKKQLKNDFSSTIVENIKFEISKSTQKIESKINLEDNDMSTLSNLLWFTYNKNKSSTPIKVWFKNVEINEQQIELYRVKKDLQKFLDEQHPIEINGITTNQLIQKLEKYKKNLIDKEEIKSGLGVEIPENDLGVVIKGQIQRHWDELFGKKDVVSIIIYLNKGGEQIQLDKELFIYIK